MDIAALTAFLAPALPYLMQVGGKAVDGFIQQIGADVWEKTKQIWDRLRPNVEAKPAALEAFQDVAKSPQDEDMQAAMRVQLKKLLDSDASLTEDLEQLLQQVSYHAEVHGSGAIAQGEGAVAAGEGGIAVGGDVHGGIKVDK